MSAPSRSGRRERPPRLRDACNRCNSLKVKCSGEKDGCTRCVKSEVPCIYRESRVGKNQAGRRRRESHISRHSDEADDSNECSPGADTRSGSPKERLDFTTPAESGPTDHMLSYANSFMNDSGLDTVSPYDSILADAPEQQMMGGIIPHMDNFAFGTTFSESMLSSCTFNANDQNSAGDAGKNAWDLNATTITKSQLDIPMSLPGGGSTELELQTIRSCVTMLMELANYLDLGKETFSLDIILPTIKKIAAKLEGLLESLQNHVYFTAMCMLGIIVDKCVDLLQTASKGIGGKQGAADGSLEEDEDQQDYQCLRLRNMIRRLSNIAQRIESVETEVVESRVGVGAVAPTRSRSRLWTHLEARLVELRQQTERRLGV